MTDKWATVTGGRVVRYSSEGSEGPGFVHNVKIEGLDVGEQFTSQDHLTRTKVESQFEDFVSRVVQRQCAVSGIVHTSSPHPVRGEGLQPGAARAVNKCEECGEYFCNDHFNVKAGMCWTCVVKEQQRKELEEA